MDQLPLRQGWDGCYKDRFQQPEPSKLLHIPWWQLMSSRSMQRPHGEVTWRSYYSHSGSWSRWGLPKLRSLSMTCLIEGFVLIDHASTILERSTIALRLTAFWKFFSHTVRHGAGLWKHGAVVLFWLYCTSTVRVLSYCNTHQLEVFTKACP